MPYLPVDVLVLKGFEEALQLVRGLGVVGLARASAESACVRHRGVWRRPLHELRHALFAEARSAGEAGGDNRRTIVR